MSNLLEGDYRTMLEHFRANDLKALLEAFGQNNTGKRTELRELALELLSSRPDGLHYEAYLSKIYEIYHLLPCHRSGFSDNNVMFSSMQTQQEQMMPMGQILMLQQTMYQLPQYHQQSMYMPQARVIYGNSTEANTIPGNIMANNQIQYAYGSHQPVIPQIIVPPPRSFQMTSSLRNINAMKQNTSKPVFKASISILQVIANYKFKKIPFYEVIEDIIKPIPLDGSNKCTLSNFFKGTKECTFVHTMTNKQVNLIAMNQDISCGKTIYEYQYQIRICQLENGKCDEVTDDLPIGLHIRVGTNDCTLPSIVTDDRSRIKCKRAAEPINITQYLKLSPIHSNIITINWIPDGKNYALAMFIVKQLSVNTLIKKLIDKNPKSSEETKNYIIKKLTIVDPDLTTTSSYTFSLICPLSKVRIKVPAKSIHCDHIQCFDAGTFILLNENKPKWMCPTCNKSCLYDEIQIENYFLEIITSPTLRNDVNVIEVLADGSWIIPEENKDGKNMNITIDNKVKSIDFINLDDIVNEKRVELNEKPRTGGSKGQESENLKPHLIDITMDEDEKQSKQKDKLQNVTQAADTRQLVTKDELKAQA